MGEKKLKILIELPTGEQARRIQEQRDRHRRMLNNAYEHRRNAEQSAKGKKTRS